ncbi:hypothetical protein I4F81_007565 [Pyropia yezoensis]|uniref:Uncharacterized protein n=1 Tax=Pyropia yezoensis TaxID=2788 RepID=A0ACC3C4Z9_PYRYE|nr:hypothetical protein I4F81_007565 [Neopyropia yezoensis]
MGKTGKYFRPSAAAAASSVVSVSVGHGQLPVGETKVRVSTYSGVDGGLVMPSQPLDDVTLCSPWDLLEHASKLYPQKRCFGCPVTTSGGAESLTVPGNEKKSSSWITFRLAERRASSIGMVFSDVLRLTPGQAVGIMAANSAEWQLVHLAASSRRLVVVPLYATLSASAVAQIVDHAEIVALFVGARQLPTVSTVRAQCGTLQHTVVIDSESPDLAVDGVQTLSTLLDCCEGPNSFSTATMFASPSTSGASPPGLSPNGAPSAPFGSSRSSSQGAHRSLSPTSPSGLVSAPSASPAVGRGSPRAAPVGDSAKSARNAERARLDEVAVLIYTSGTGGVPKGVMLTNGNLIAAVTGFMRANDQFELRLGADDVALSILPLAHVFELTLSLAFLLLGVGVGFSSGNSKTLLEDIRCMNPTILPAVPRMLSRVEDTIRAALAQRSTASQRVFWWAYKKQLRMVTKRKGFDDRRRSAQLDRLVFNGLREAILPNVKIVLSGAAPLPPETHLFLRVACNVRICQGYGMSETAAAVSVGHPCTSAAGNVGGLLPVAQVKLRDVPSMGYTSKDKPPRGEIMVRGPSVFKGYHKNKPETDEALIDGWLCTGDIGKWNADGSLAIIDRRKNILSLATGEHVAVENVTSELVKSPFVTQLWIHVSPGESVLVAVVVPNKLYIELQWAPKYGHPPSLETLVASPEAQLKQAVLSDLQRQAKVSKLPPHERVRNVSFETNLDASGMGFTMENELLTPTHKLRRPALAERYESEVLRMYGELGRSTRLSGAEKALKSALSPKAVGLTTEFRSKKSRRGGGGGAGASMGSVASPGGSSSGADARKRDGGSVLDSLVEEDGEEDDVLEDDDDLSGDDDDDDLEESDSDSDEEADGKRGALSTRKSRSLLPMKKKKAAKKHPDFAPSKSFLVSQFDGTEKLPGVDEIKQFTIRAPEGAFSKSLAASQSFKTMASSAPPPPNQ